MIGCLFSCLEELRLHHKASPFPTNISFSPKCPTKHSECPSTALDNLNVLVLILPFRKINNVMRLDCLSGCCPMGMMNGCEVLNVFHIM